MDLACALLGSPLFDAAVRCEPLSAEAAASLVAPAVTLKADGTRCLLVCDQGRMTPVRAMGAGGEEACELRGFWVLDAEQMAGPEPFYFVLDVLVALGRDVRCLPLPDRIRPLAGAGRLRPKPYRYLPPGGGLPEDLDVTGGAGSDGLIVLDALAPYWQPPFKFKPHMTVDVLLRREGGRCLPLVSSRDGLTAWRGRGPYTVEPPAVDASLLDRVVECRLVLRGKRVHLLPLRSRDDRPAPNGAFSANSNLLLLTSGGCEPAWVRRALRARGGPEVLRAWVRRLACCALEACGATGAACEGLWRFDTEPGDALVCLFCAPPLPAGLRALVALEWRPPPGQAAGELGDGHMRLRWGDGPPSFREQPGGPEHACPGGAPAAALAAGLRPVWLPDVRPAPGDYALPGPLAALAACVWVGAFAS